MMKDRDTINKNNMHNYLIIALLFTITIKTSIEFFILTILEINNKIAIIYFAILNKK
jgi:hypothetical protein